MRPQPTLDLNRPDGVWSPPSSQGCFPTPCGRTANHSLPTSCGFQRADAAAVFSWKSTPSMMHAVPPADLRKDSMVSDFTVFALRTVHNDSPSIRDSEHRGSTIATSRAGPDSLLALRQSKPRCSFSSHGQSEPLVGASLAHSRHFHKSSLPCAVRGKYALDPRIIESVLLSNHGLTMCIVDFTPSA